ncbi:hypothetical protein CBM2615_A290003 [Cupriavidus taiwanensis]|nr:hypothetical protein CBM2615_A290003 [Cupriavidus taiwanensis]
MCNGTTEPLFLNAGPKPNLIMHIGLTRFEFSGVVAAKMR